ncbi:MAG: hypothetical protein ACRDH0_02810 [Actinomycetota bacterium]
MSWLIVVALGIIWVAFLFPSSRRMRSLRGGVEDFERKMGRLAETGTQGPGRWIITPRKGTAFIGPTARAEARGRDRRRQVFEILLESIGITFLMGLVPPLRPVWSATVLLLVLLGVYVWLLLAMKQQSGSDRARQMVRQANPPDRPRPVLERYVSEGRVARPALNGLGVLDGDDLSNIVVRPAGEVGMAGV